MANTEHHTQFFYVSAVKAAILTFLTFGIYVAYWLYKHWMEIHRSEKLAKFPVANCIITVLIMYPLVSKFQRAIAAKHAKVSVFPVALSFAYITPWLFWGESDLRYLLILSAVTAAVVWFAQARVNQAFAPDTKLKFNGKEIAAAILGAIMWALVTFGNTLVIPA